MIKVMQFIHGLSMGGAETLVKDYCLRLEKNFDLVVLCITRCNSPYDDILRDAGIRVIYVEDNIKEVKWLFGINKFYRIIQRFLLIRKYIREERPDILHTHLPVNIQVMFAKPYKPIKIFHTVHSVPEELWNSSFKRRLDYKAAKWLIKNYNMQFIVLSDEMRQQINELFYVDDSVILNNGIDFEKFNVKNVKGNLRQEFGISEETFIVGHVGRFSKSKNHIFLIDVFEKIVERRKDSLLILVGSGELKKCIIKEVEKRNLGKKVLFLENRTDIPEIMKIMDVFIFPSICEGLGIVLIEAQKMHLRCVISDKIPKAAVVSNLVKVNQLTESAEIWSDTVLNFPITEVKYKQIEEWNMDNIVLKLQELYLQNREGCM